jgi:hypothetical protein
MGDHADCGVLSVMAMFTSTDIRRAIVRLGTMAATLVTHPEDRQRSRLPRLRTGLMAFGYLVLALVVAASAYQWLAHTRDLHHNPPPVRLVDVGGYRMHIN